MILLVLKLGHGWWVWFLESFEQPGVCVRHHGGGIGYLPLLGSENNIILVLQAQGTPVTD
jgi:hypothetical protein